MYPYFLFRRDIVNYFKLLDFKRNSYLSLSTVGKMYIVCAILRNALTCKYTNSTSQYFALDPPTLEDFFSWTFTSIQASVKHKAVQNAYF